MAGGTMDKNQYFEQIYKEYYPSIYSFIYYRVRSVHQSEDLAQDVFLSVYNNISKYDYRKSFITTWLYAITANRLKNYYKSSKRREFPCEKNTFDSGDQGMMAHNEEMRIIMDCLLNYLSKRNQKILRLKYYYGMNSKEIAKIMKLTPGNVRIILKRSLSALKAHW
jgi:RNA polymerase sigma-70 factor (ECF subfamily)